MNKTTTATTPVEMTLSTLLEEVATALGETVAKAGVSFHYCFTEGEWTWQISVEPVYRPHGNGRRLVRGGTHGTGLTPEEATKEVLRRIAIPGYLAIGTPDEKKVQCARGAERR